jgi:hypothetical protein
MTQAIADRVQQVQADQAQGTQLRIVPILGPSSEEPPYRLLDHNSMGAVKVTEVSAAGTVPELKVENTLEVRVYLMDGQELVGAKQNRILNTDVLVPAKSTIAIPVSCVEQGRWDSVSAQFSSGKSASSRTRANKSDRVYASLKSSGHHDADQGAVWDEVHSAVQSSGAASPTGALSDAYAMRDQELRAFRGQLRMPENAVGLAVFHGDRFKGLDLFDRHATLQYFWESLVDSYALDWLGAQVEATKGEAGDSMKEVRKVLQKAAKGTWEPFASPGEGRDFRLKSRSYSGSALVFEDKAVLHLQVFPKLHQEQTGRTGRPRIHRPYGSGPQTVY